MNTSDVILHLIEMVIAEKEKNFMFQQNQLQNQVKDNTKNKD